MKPTSGTHICIDVGSKHRSQVGRLIFTVRRAADTGKQERVGDPTLPSLLNPFHKHAPAKRQPFRPRLHPENAHACLG